MRLTIHDGLRYRGITMLAWDDGPTNIFCGVPTYSVTEFA